MAQLKIAPHLLIQALFGGCDIVTGLRINGATFDPKNGGTVLLDIEGPGVPEHGEVVAEITKARQSVRFLATGGPIPSQPVTVGMDMASGPDMGVMATLTGGKWMAVGQIDDRVVVAHGKRIPLERLQVKDTMADDVARAFGLPVHLVSDDNHLSMSSSHPIKAVDVKAGTFELAEPAAKKEPVLLGASWASDETRPALSPLEEIIETIKQACADAFTIPAALTDPQAPWPFGSAKPITLLPEEADDDGHPKALPANGNLLMVR